MNSPAVEHLNDAIAVAAVIERTTDVERVNAALTNDFFPTLTALPPVDQWSVVSALMASMLRSVPFQERQTYSTALTYMAAGQLALSAPPLDVSKEMAEALRHIAVVGSA